MGVYVYHIINLTNKMQLALSLLKKKTFNMLVEINF